MSNLQLYGSVYFPSLSRGWRGVERRRVSRGCALAHNAQVAFVVDDIASVRPWRVRCLEIRGTAEALTGVESYLGDQSDALIRIHPDRVIAFGLSPESLQH